MAEIDWKSKADEYTLGRPVGFLFERPADSVNAAYLAGVRAGLVAAELRLLRKRDSHEDGYGRALTQHHAETIRALIPA